MSETSNNDSDASGSERQRAELSLRSPLRGVSGLRRRSIRLAIASIALVVAAALIIGLGIDFRSHGPSDPRKVETPPENMQPSPIADLPNSYAQVPRPKVAAAPQPGEPGMHHHDQMMPVPGADDPNKADLARLLSSIQQVGQKNKELADQIAAYHSAAAQQQAKVWASGVFFKLDEFPGRRGEEPFSEGKPATDQTEWLARANAVAASAVPPPQSPATPPPTDQQHKLSFLTESPDAPPSISPAFALPTARRGKSEGYLLQTGSVIPAALLTGINTDLPGDVVATVTAPVYDSPTGDHLLIPQGARLYGAYDSQVAPSQDRALLMWHRLLLPDGRSVDLNRMRGTDAAGSAGVADRVNYHADKLAGAAVLSGAIAYAGNLARGRQSLTQTAGDVVGDAVAQQAAGIGSSIVQRQLNVQPTIIIRPGWPVRVLVNRDILLPPYNN